MPQVLTIKALQCKWNVMSFYEMFAEECFANDVKSKLLDKLEALKCV
jgi:hypothetical protein